MFDNRMGFLNLDFIMQLLFQFQCEEHSYSYMKVR